jgi:hypothetical protein
MNLASTSIARRIVPFIASATLALLASVAAMAHEPRATADTAQPSDSKACEVRTVRRIGGHPGKQLVPKQRISKIQCTRTSGDAVSGYRR